MFTSLVLLRRVSETVCFAAECLPSLLFVAGCIVQLLGWSVFDFPGFLPSCCCRRHVRAAMPVPVVQNPCARVAVDEDPTSVFAIA